jgi:hypothetical protein
VVLLRSDAFRFSVSHRRRESRAPERTRLGGNWPEYTPLGLARKGAVGPARSLAVRLRKKTQNVLICDAGRPLGHVDDVVAILS